MNEFKILHIYYISVLFMAIGMFYLSKTIYDIKDIKDIKDKDKKNGIIDYSFRILCSFLTFLSGIFLFFISTSGCNNYVKIIYLLMLCLSCIVTGVFQSYMDNNDNSNNIKKYIFYSIYIVMILFGLFIIPRGLKCYPSIS